MTLNKKTDIFGGPLLCARYAFMPNRLEFCGGQHNLDLFERGVKSIVDPFLNVLLTEFQTLYPYLKLIASCNNISDPFDYRVVEAYWIGNNLLEKTTMKKFYNHFTNHLHLKKQLTKPQFKKLIGKIPASAIPHHNFHVFNVWLGSTIELNNKIVALLDSCRISVGKIVQIFQNEVTIETDRLFLANNQIQINKPITKKVTYKYLNESFIKNPEIGHLVSLHWNFVCDTLTPAQAHNLKKYTQYSLALANKSLTI